MPQYTNISSKEWDKLLELDLPPNVQDILRSTQAYGRRAIVPTSEIMNCFSGINQVNQAFIKNGVLIRLRIIQGGYPREGFLYPDGCLVQLTKKVQE